MNDMKLVCTEVQFILSLSDLQCVCHRRTVRLKTRLTRKYLSEFGK